MIVCHIITGLHNGGAEGGLFRLCTAHSSADYRHIVISLSAPGIYVERLEKAGIPVYCLNMPRGRLTLNGLITLYRLLKKIKPDVVQTWMYHADLVGGLVSRLCGIRNIAWGIHHANLDPALNRSATLLVVRICALLSKSVPARIVNCSQLSIALHKSVGYCPDKFVYIPNGYLLDRFVPDKEAGLAVRRTLLLPETVPVLGMVARFDPQKDHNNLIQALGLLKQKGVAFVCLLVGTNMVTENKVLMTAIEKENVTSEIKLLNARDDIPAIMNALDIHVLSSAGEAFPNVLAEAMACGTPCVSTDVGDARFILGKTGWVVPSANASALADAIADALVAMCDRPAWEQRQQAARRHIVDNFSSEKMVRAYQQVWESMLNSKNKNRMP